MNNTFDMSRLAADALSASACTRVRVWSPLTPDGVARSARSARGTSAQGTATRGTASIDTTPGYALLDKRSTGSTGTTSTGTTSINDPEKLGSPPLWRSN